MKPLSPKAIDWLILTIADLTIPAVLAWERHAGEASSRITLAVGIFTLVIANAVYIGKSISRRKQLGEKISRGFVAGAGGFMLLAGLLIAVVAYSVPVRPERNDDLQLAFSNVPLDEIQPEQKALVVEFLRHRAANSAAENQLLAQLKPISPPLYTPASFASEQVIKGVIEQLSNAYDVDRAYDKSLKQTVNDFETKMMKVDPEYLKAFEESMQNQQTLQEKTEQLEQAWFAATIDLYNYADTHAADISVKHGQMHFANDNMRIYFSVRVQNSKSLYDEFQDSQHQSLKLQQDSMARTGFGAGN